MKTRLMHKVIHRSWGEGFVNISLDLSIPISHFPPRLLSVLLEKRLKGIFLIHDVRPDVPVKLLGRYGMRRYKEAFSERNINFWTIGPHADWRVAPKINLGLSYHYERGPGGR